MHASSFNRRKDRLIDTLEQCSARAMGVLGASKGHSNSEVRVKCPGGNVLVNKGEGGRVFK